MTVVIELEVYLRSSHALQNCILGQYQLNILEPYTSTGQSNVWLEIQYFFVAVY
jgi:hypothetical protein